MHRSSDEGPYAVGNVEIISAVDNFREAMEIHYWVIGIIPDPPDAPDARHIARQPRPCNSPRCRSGPPTASPVAAIRSKWDISAAEGGGSLAKTSKL
ncbi:hypothetical protein ACVW1A_006955 [Bradyrhizobium sp. LB1.3]